MINLMIGKRVRLARCYELEHFLVRGIGRVALLSQGKTDVSRREGSK